MSYKVNDPVYNWDLPSSYPDSLVRQVFENHSSLQQKTTFKRSEKKIDSYAWTITEGIKAGAEVSYSAGSTGGFGGKVSLELNFSSTQGKTHATERTWEADQDISEAPYTINEVEWVLERQKQSYLHSQY